MKLILGVMYIAVLGSRVSIGDQCKVCLRGILKTT